MVKSAGLPVRLSSFVGRETAIADLRDQLGRHRLLTLTGPGGTGKTRLALAVALAEADDYLDGAAFVDLGPIVDPELVPSTTRERLEAAAIPGGSPTDAVVKHLTERQELLVLDNFEQVLPAAPFVAELLARCPDLHLLVTSRAPLRLEGEQEWPVAPLGLPDSTTAPTLTSLGTSEAIQLFADRARSVQPEFALSEANASSVVDVCRRLEGIPLAIELAAAQVRLIPPSMLSERLANSIDLEGGGRDVPERQQTLRNAIAWSVDLLDDADRRLFQRLAVFRGWVAFEAVQRVAADAGGPDVMNGLQRLLEHSLIKSERGDDPRGSMLETIRTFAADGLLGAASFPRSRGATRTTSSRSPRRRLRSCSGRVATRGSISLGRDHDNIRAAIGWATAVGDIGTALRFEHHAHDLLAPPEPDDRGAGRHRRTARVGSERRRSCRRRGRLGGGR